MEGCGVGKGYWWRHAVAMCANCKGPHAGHALACPTKNAARSEAKGWRSPSPRWRQQDASPRLDPPPTATGQRKGEEEVEETRHESSSGEEIDE